MDLTKTSGSEKNYRKEAGEQQETNNALARTVSSLKSSFQQEILRANKLRQEVTNETKKLLQDIQHNMNTQLNEMDGSMRALYEGQTLMDTNIQLLVKKIEATVDSSKQIGKIQ